MDLFATLLLALIALVIGVLLGMLLSGMRESKKDSEEVTHGDLEPVTGLWRDRETGQLVAEAGGKVFHSVEEMNEGERQLFEAAAAELRRWSGSAGTVETEKKRTAVSVPAGLEASGGHHPAVTGNREPSQPAPGSNLNPFKVFGMALIPGKEAGTGPGSQSIVLQIDEILQKNLKNFSLEGRGIRLQDLPGQGMVVTVGFENYGSIDEVPDPEIREAIQQAVSEWESRIAGK